MQPYHYYSIYIALLYVSLLLAAVSFAAEFRGFQNVYNNESLRVYIDCRWDGERGKTGCITKHRDVQQRSRIRPGALLYYKSEWSTLSKLGCQMHTCAGALSPQQRGIAARAINRIL